MAIFYLRKELTDGIGDHRTDQDDEYEYRYVERINMLEMEIEKKKKVFSLKIPPLPLWCHFSSLRHVTLPKEIAQWIPHSGILADDEWRSLGVKQSYGWEHYMVHGMLN
jgi:cyclin-dependent kinase regulatory subunit CKS1